MAPGSVRSRLRGNPEQQRPGADMDDATARRQSVRCPGGRSSTHRQASDSRRERTFRYPQAAARCHSDARVTGGG